MIKKRGHWWLTLIHFLCSSLGYMLDAKFLFYWAGVWSLYHAVRYITWKEETNDASSEA